MTTTTATPREIDTKLAAIWTEIAASERRFGFIANDLLHLAGATYYYRGRKRVTDMTLAQAVERVTEAAAYIEAYQAANVTTEGGYTGTNWDGYNAAQAHGVQTYDTKKPAEYLAKLADQRAILADLAAKERAVADLYAGWSRFFLVTSSAGHVHRSMACSTCRPTTTYGWLPELSGKDEAAAVAELGPNLCTVCFPSAPVAWTGGKLTAAQAAKRSA